MRGAIQRVAGALLLAAVAWALPGCSFAYLDGNGPKAREVYAAELPSAAKAQLGAWKADAFRRHWLLRTQSRVQAKGYTLHTGASFPWTGLAGCASESTFIHPSPETQAELRAVVSRAEGCGVLGIFASRVWSRWYDYPSGECIMASQWTWLGGPLLVFGSDTDPSSEDKPQAAGARRPDWTSLRVPLKDLKYNRTTFVCLGLGLVAWGTRNGRAYAQLFWVPIPLWSVRQGH